ncbi:MAG: HAD family hydrolase [Bacillota bacterium]
MRYRLVATDGGGAAKGGVRPAPIGDDENDIPFLSAAGLGIAMGNAVDEVKAVAGAVTGSNTADGWATAMERFVFAG